MSRFKKLPPSKPIEHLFFYREIFLCLVYSDQTWYLYDTPEEAFGGCVGKNGGKEKALITADRICKNMEDRAKRDRGETPE
jgi:hypothetical protein